MRRPAREQDTDWMAQAAGPRKPADLAVPGTGTGLAAPRSRMPVPQVIWRCVTGVIVHLSVSVLVASALIAFTQASAMSLSPPSVPSSEQVCGSSSLNGPSSPPGGAVTVAAGDNSAVNFSLTNTTYWFASGTHTLGSGAFAQIQAASGSTYEGAPGAVIDGQGVNQFAFIDNGTPGGSNNVTIEYLTIQDFHPGGAAGAVNQNGVANWTVKNNTIQDNVPGAGMELGSNNVVTGNCIADNGEYAINAYSFTGGDPLTGGYSNATVTGNEIARNDTCNWEAVSNFPITKPAACGSVGFNGCGCSGGVKFWEADQGVFTGNYVHDNYAQGIWWDTNNVGWDVENNYFANNYGVAAEYEISYNAHISNNVFVGNANLLGPTNPGFPSSAVYISESGSDPRVPGFASGQFQVDNNQFYDNWGGVVLYENANRYCSSSANSSTGICTLVNFTPPPANTVRPQPPPPVRRLPRRSRPPAGRVRGIYQAGQPVISLQTCATPQLLAITPYIDDCRWKTKNVQVTGNLFDFVRGEIGASCTTANFCGFNGLFSGFGTFAPYNGELVPDHITYSQSNLFSANTYCGPWGFDPHDQGNQYSFATWQAAPYSQDPGSTVDSAACSPQVPGNPNRPGWPSRPFTFPIRIGRR